MVALTGDRPPRFWRGGRLPGADLGDDVRADDQHRGKESCGGERRAFDGAHDGCSCSPERAGPLRIAAMRNR